MCARTQLNGLDSRDLVCKELALSDAEQNRKSPLLLELVRRGRPGEQLAQVRHTCPDGLWCFCRLPEMYTLIRFLILSSSSQELSQKQISEARKRFDFYDKVSVAVWWHHPLKWTVWPITEHVWLSAGSERLCWQRRPEEHLHRFAPRHEQVGDIYH